MFGLVVAFIALSQSASALPGSEAKCAYSQFKTLQDCLSPHETGEGMVYSLGANTGACSERVLAGGSLADKKGQLFVEYVYDNGLLHGQFYSDPNCTARVGHTFIWREESCMRDPGFTRSGHIYFTCDERVLAQLPDPLGPYCSAALIHRMDLLSLLPPPQGICR